LVSVATRRHIPASFAWALALQMLASAGSAELTPPIAADAPALDLQQLLGRPALPWHVDHWFNSPPLELKALRGRVVLVRFWTAPDCPFCSASAPALNDFHVRYTQRGLTVVGFYHHKARSPLQPNDVERYAKLFGFVFPIATDSGWRTLRRWWLDEQPRAFTSASFLIDRHGIIRYIHPGGKYVQGDAAHAALQAMIERLLSQPS
jgi:peroxiredoxin